MKKSYLKGALITLSFIFVFSVIHVAFLTEPSSGPLFSPPTIYSISSMGVLELFILITPFVVGVLIVLLAYFLIAANLES